MIVKEKLGPQLRFWSIHVGLTALPSFAVALIRFNTVPAILAMLAGILTFILGYSFLCASTFYTKLTGASLIGEAVKKGTRIRLILSLATAPFLFGAFAQWPTVLLAPDFWAGFGAIMIVGFISNALGFQGVEPVEGSITFFQTYFVTIVEGLLISFTLVLLVFFVLLFLNRKAARMQQPGPPMGPGQ